MFDVDFLVEILPLLLRHLALALLVGSLASVGTNWLKGIIRTENHLFNQILAIAMVFLMTYIVIFIYSDSSLTDFVIVGFFANLGAKGLYEALEPLRAAKEPLQLPKSYDTYKEDK